MDDAQRGKRDAWLMIDDHCDCLPEQARLAVKCDGLLGMPCTDTCRCRSDALARLFGQEQLREQRGELNWQGDLDQMRLDDQDDLHSPEQGVINNRVDNA